jgi:uncharacterized protein (TIGR03067 family)
MRYRPLLIGVLVAGFAIVGAACAAPYENAAKELQLLEGVWAEDPPKGNGRRYVIYFKDGRMAWESTRYEGGEPLIGHSKGYDVQFDPTAKPKRITLTCGEGADKETRLAVYDVDGDTLKMALGGAKERPKTLEDKDAQLLTLKRVKPEE